MSSTAEPTWFITDRAIDKPEDDSFAHDDLAEQLVQIVETITPPATIGLIGGFGTGKSSVGNLLAKRLNAHSDLQVVSLSAEKHTGVARQRALVYGFAEALVEDAGVSEKDVSAVLGRVEASTDTDEPALADLPIVRYVKEHRAAALYAGKRALQVAAALVGGMILGALGMRAAGWIESNPFTFVFTTAWGFFPVIAAGFAAAATLLPGWLKAAFTPGSIKHSRPRAEAADELERIFSDLAMLVKKQLVIVVDDIDRLAPNQVLEALGTIKTLQAVPKKQPPVFIITCDDMIIRKALTTAASKPTAAAGEQELASEEFLNKLFAVRQYLPPHIKEDMLTFAESLLAASRTNHAGPKALGADLRPVLEILIHEGVADPRHVIRLLNAFFANYRLAKTRETSGARLGKGEITDRPLLLARLAVLQVDFPAVYEAVRSDYELLRALDVFAVDGDLDQAQDDLLALYFPGKQAKPDVPAELADFMRRTAPYFDDDISLSPFFYFGQTPAGRVLGSRRADEIRRALENNNLELIKQRLTEAPEQAPAAVDHMITTLGQARPGLPLRNVVSTSASALTSVPELERKRLANEIANIILRGATPVPGPQQLADTLRFADAAHEHGLKTKLTMFEDELEAAEARADVVLALAAERPADTDLTTALTRHFAKLPDLAGWSTAPAWFERASGIAPATRSKILDASFYATMLHLAVGAPEGGVTSDHVATLVQLLDDAPAAVRADARVLNAIKSCLSAASVDPRRLAAIPARHLQPTPDLVGPVLVAAAEAVLDDVGLDEAAHLDVMRLITLWSTDYSGPVGQIEADAAARVGEAIAATATGNDDEPATDDDLTAAAEALAAFGRAQPAAVDPAVEAITDALDERRDDSPVGRALRDALIALVPTAPNAAALVQTVTSPIEASTKPTADDTRAALSSIPLIMSTPAGKQLVTAALPTWRQRITAVSTPAAAQVAVAAAATVANLGGLDEEEGTEWLARIGELPSHGQNFVGPAAVAAATIKWPTTLQVDATQLVGAHWEQLADDEKSEVVELIAAWDVKHSALDPVFAERLAAYFGDTDTPSEVLDALPSFWAAMGEHRAYVAGNLADRPTFPTTELSVLDTDELVQTLHYSANPTARAVVVREIGGMDAPKRDEVTAAYIEAGFAGTDVEWREDAVQEVLSAVPTLEGVAGLAPTLIGRLHNGEAEAAKAALALAAVAEKSPAAITGHADELVAAIEALLPTVGVPVAELLGKSARSIHFDRFRDTLKTLRKDKDDQRAREVAGAFEDAHKRK